ncbi:MAG TPA: hypothetical protein VLG36_02580 [Candidatus Chromulinivoraceae bacterium]|nr:hypothetical protein [Candidatus Chromulinivoraceae bacterium]
MDWETLRDLHDETVSQLKDITFHCALVTRTKVILTADEEIYTYTHFHCGEEGMVAHFTASLLERLGFGDFSKLLKALARCDELLAFQTSSDWSFHTRTRGDKTMSSRQ